MSRGTFIRCMHCGFDNDINLETLGKVYNCEKCKKNILEV